MIFCDPLFHFVPKDIAARRHGTQWSHLFASSPLEISELHRIARAAGLKLEWFDRLAAVPHYDVIPASRTKAIAAGAVDGTRENLKEAILVWRKAGWSSKDDILAEIGAAP